MYHPGEGKYITKWENQIVQHYLERWGKRSHLVSD